LVATGMALDPNKGDRSLLRGRTSQAGAEYVLTFCTELRRNGLTSPEVARHILGELDRMTTDAIWSPRSAVIMPDHVHLLVQLGDKLSLGRAIARLKAKSGQFLKQAGIQWQDGYYEHRLRSHEDPLPVFLYIYLNPYRAGLLSSDQRWPWFTCSEPDRSWFTSLLDQGLPEPDWLSGLP
jgi:putative transposase